MRDPESVDINRATPLGEAKVSVRFAGFVLDLDALCALLLRIRRRLIKSEIATWPWVRQQLFSCKLLQVCGDVVGSKLVRVAAEHCLEIRDGRIRGIL